MYKLNVLLKKGNKDLSFYFSEKVNYAEVSWMILLLN